MDIKQKWSNHIKNAVQNDKQNLLKSYDQKAIQKHVRNYLADANMKLAFNHHL